MTHSDYDAQLHLLRSVARLHNDPRVTQAIESARFNVYAQLQAGDAADALRWLRALEMAIRAAGFAEAIENPALDAIREIREGLEGK